MRNSVIISMASLAASALARGTAHVVNQCKYDVHLCNVPAAGGGYSEIDEVLSSGGGTYSQAWTELSNGMGWSIKLAKTENYQTDVMQYEYTFHNDGKIWYDLSEVNGNPWNGNWMIEAEGNCTPRQAAYRHSTDDAYGMQDCPDDSDITVTLCSGELDDGSDSGSASSSVSSEVLSSSTEVDELPAYTPTPSAETTTAAYSDVEAVAAVATPSPTTLLTQKVSTSSAANGAAVTVTQVATQVVTAYVTETAGAKRHEHHARHPRERRAE